MSNKITNKFLKSLNFKLEDADRYSTFWYIRTEHYLINYIKENNLFVLLDLDENVAVDYTIDNKTTFLKLLTLCGVTNGRSENT